MKTYAFRLIAVVSVILASFAACTPDEDPNSLVSISVTPYVANLDVGQTLSLTASLNPATATDPISWSSSDGSVATVSNGTVTAVGPGTATITATAGGKTATCTVTIAQQVESVTIDKTEATLMEGESLQLTATVSPSNASYDEISWSSSDKSIAYVYKGKVEGLLLGKVTITAQVGNKTATCEVTVKEPEYKAKERAALVAFFKANNGENWTDYHKENWCTDKPLWSWTGVSMTEDQKHVNHLWITDDNLQGRIPKEIGDLTELEVLHLINENGDNTKTYPMPEEIGKLTKLNDIYFWYYPISGKLPESLFDLPNLERLALKHAPLDKWTIPASITKLQKIRELHFFDCNLTGKIPEELGQLSGLEDLYLANNDLSGTLPASLGNLINLKQINLSANKLSGAIPTAVANMDNYWRLWAGIFQGNKFTMDNLRDSKVPAPKSPKIKMLSGNELDIESEFGKNQYTVLFSFNPDSGDAVECLAQLVSLYKVNKSKGLGIITFMDNNLTESDMTEKDGRFKSVLAKYGVPWDSFIRHMYDVYPAGAPFYAEKGLGMYPHDVENSIVILGPDQTIVYSTIIDPTRDYLNNAVAFIQKVFKTTVTHYESKSYSQDGKVTTLQKASTGKGIDLVITGDAFSDRYITDGTFKNVANQAVKDLFSVEPYKSMKSRFNIYLVNAVSKHEEYFNGCSTVFGGVFGSGSAVGGNNQKVLEYAKKAVPDNTRMDNVAVLVLMNTLRSGGTSYMMNPSSSGTYAGGAAVCWVPFKDASVSGGLSEHANTIVHELGGHGIAKLGDEYAYRDQGKISTEEVNYAKDEQKNKDWYLNVDFTSDPAKVLWSQFIGDSAFASENIGVYEGGFTYWLGVWRPTQQSVMNNSYSYSTFNAPCRSLIYTRIMKLSEGSSWQYDYNAFKTWDKAHPTTTKVATRSMVEVDGEAPVHVPPVIVGKTWEEVIGY